MRRLLTTFLIISILGMAVLGFLAMDHNGNHAGCIASAAQGGVCPQEDGPLGLVAFHFDALRNFSKAVLGLMSLTVILLLVLMILNAASHAFATPPHPYISQKTRLYDVEPRIYFQYRLLNWLTLQEKRDPASSLSFRFQT